MEGLTYPGVHPHKIPAMAPPIVRSPHSSSDNDEAERPYGRHDEAERLGRHGVPVNNKEIGVDGDGSGEYSACDIALRPQPALRPAGLRPHMNGVVVDPDEIGNERGGLNDIGDEKHVDEDQEGVIALVAAADIGHRADHDLFGAVRM